MFEKVVHILHKAEEGLLAFLLAAMTLVTFTQVVARYVFNSGWIAALEITTFLFAWLVILGISWGIRIHSHIGVDVIVKLFPNPAQRILGLVAALAGITYAGLLLYGGWAQISEVLYPFGIEVEDIPMPFGDHEEEQKLPLWVPYSVVLIGFAMVIVRLLVAKWQIVTGTHTGLMIGDEGKDVLEAYADSEAKEDADLFSSTSVKKTDDREGTK